ncbi:MAG: demethoxyubiquinone hydroxylase family protein [Congregibacter sp.]
MSTLTTARLPKVSSLPLPLKKDLRSDHAGETGAVYIYHGILAVSGDADIRAFAREHLQTEREHLRAFDEWLEPAHKSRLLPVWRLAGWTLGALSVLGGRNSVFLTIDAVERFVVEHYAQQISFLAGDPAWASLKAMLTTFMNEEDHHREDAAQRTAGEPGLLGRLWVKVVDKGSAAGVSVSRAL